MLRIYGASDDLIEVDGHVSEEYCPPYGIRGWLELQDGPATLLVGFEFAPTDSPGNDGDGTWTASVQVPAEGGEVPWPVTIRTGTDDECSYSVTVEIDCPDTVSIRQCWGES